MVDPQPFAENPVLSQRTGTDGDPFEPLTATFRRIVELATRGIPGCDAATISLLAEGDLVTTSWSEDAVLQIDRAQYATGGPCVAAADEGVVVVVDDLNQDDRWPGLHEVTRSRGIGSSLSLPMRVGDHRLGSLNLYARSKAAFGAESVRVATAFADPAAFALANAHAYSVAVTDALALQRNLLPARLPDVAGLCLAVRYLPASDGGDVGGDWYDALCLSDDQLALAVGDVAGHGVPAASVMGQLRNGLRAYAVAGSSPGEAVGLLSRMLDVVEPDAIATLCHLVLDLADGHDRSVTMRWASAGHLPPLVVARDGSCRLLPTPADPLLGAAVTHTYRETTTTIEPGETLLLYTDGLVERRGESIDAGLRRLVREAAEGPEELDAFCDHLVRRLVGPARRDDVALLAVRLDPDRGRSAPAGD